MSTLAVIADVHGNADALRAVLADIDRRGITDIANLGDMVSGPLAANHAAALLRARPMTAVRGNHDRDLVEQPPDAMHASDKSAYDKLSRADLAWLSALPPTARMAGGRVFLCHATPADDQTYWLETLAPDGRAHLRPQDDIRALTGDTRAEVILCGHTHIPRAVQLPGGPLIVNPGSVGCPGYTDDAPIPHVMQTALPHASYATLHHADAGWQVDFHLVPYDTSRMVAMAHTAGRDDWAQAIGTGWLDFQP